MIIETKKAADELSPSISLVFPDNPAAEKSGFPIDPNPANLPDLNDLSDEYIRNRIANCSNIVFEVTQACNFRCRYCAYSGLYPENRTHKNAHMELAVAKSALDVFAGSVFSGARTSRNKITIGFYGGEPLLRCDFIKNMVDYSKSITDEFDQAYSWNYRFTTNGYLLTPNILPFLIKNDFSCDISIDGPAEEHDKFRVLKGGAPTWAVIWDNILYIKENFPEYFSRKKVRFKFTIHPDHDLLKLEEFLQSNRDVFTEDNTIFSILNIYGLPDAVARSWSKKYSEAAGNIKKMDKDFWLMEELLAGNLVDKFSKSTFILKQAREFTGNCFPGEFKLYVNRDGTFSICEKIDPGYYIGDCQSGYDLKAIRELEKKWLLQIKQRGCWACKHWFLCNACFVKCIKNGDFIIDDNFCKTVGQSLKKSVSEYINILEVKSEEVQDIHHGVADFIERL